MAGTYLHWLGTGGGLHPELGDTSFLVRGDGDRTLLVDCGSTVPIVLMEENLIESVTDVAITHMHADHIGGLERFGFYMHFRARRRGKKRPRLHLATADLAHRLWEHGLRAGMEHCFEFEGGAFDATLDTYFDVRVGEIVSVDGLPKVEFIETPHVPNMENYALAFANGVYYSGDTTDLPPFDAELIFQDCAFDPEDQSPIHISYEALARDLPAHVKKRTWLVHAAKDKNGYRPHEAGFAGVVQPGQTFEL